jgi:hypothetical protein
LKIRAYMTVALFLAVCAPQGLRGQTPACQFRGAPDALRERPSPLDSVLVRLGGSDAKLCYGRPSTGGRTIIGAEHPFGTPWERGANEPTTLHLPFPARVGSVDLAPGAYSLYAIPGVADWTIVVNANPDRWGVPLSADVRAADLGSFTVVPQEGGEAIDTLTFSFMPSGAGRGMLVFEWERLTLSIPVVRR